LLSDVENIFKWSRYLYRTCKLRDISFKEFDKNYKEGIYPNEMYLLYFALLYVTIEAFRAYGFKDKRINILIGKKYNNILLSLKKLRNSMFHPNKNLISSRQKQFLSESNLIIPWAYLLTDEFERYLYFYPENINMPKNYVDEFRKQIMEIKNWLPNSSLAIVREKTLKNIEDYKDYVKKKYPQHFEEFNKECDTLILYIKETSDSPYEKEYFS
jgi:hypothetical protein